MLCLKPIQFIIGKIRQMAESININYIKLCFEVNT